MDWMTLSIELVGLLILGIWIIIPITEFREIFAKLRPPRGFDVVPPESKEDHH